MKTQKLMRGSCKSMKKIGACVLATVLMCASFGLLTGCDDGTQEEGFKMTYELAK